MRDCVSCARTLLSVPATKQVEMHCSECAAHHEPLQSASSARKSKRRLKGMRLIPLRRVFSCQSCRIGEGVRRPAAFLLVLPCKHTLSLCALCATVANQLECDLCDIPHT